MPDEIDPRQPQMANERDAIVCHGVNARGRIERRGPPRPAIVDQDQLMRCGERIGHGKPECAVRREPGNEQQRRSLIVEIDVTSSEARHDRGGEGYRRRPPPSNDPRTPRTISRPTVDPTVRAALFAIASTTLSLRPLPVMSPPSDPLSESIHPPPEAP